MDAAHKPAEVAKEDWAAVAQSPPWAVDSWGLGCLVQEAFSGSELARTEDLRNLGPIPKPVVQVRPTRFHRCRGRALFGSLHALLSQRPVVKCLGEAVQDYQRLLASAPSRRLNPSKLAESSVLKNKLVDSIAFLENLALKDSAEKDAFFRRLPAAIPALPLPVAQQKLLPMLAGKLSGC